MAGDAGADRRHWTAPPSHWDDASRLGWDLLRRAVCALPMPASSPDRSSRDALGLDLLLAALRLEHVERVIETLRLDDATHLTRSMTVDVNLDRLTPARLRSLAVPEPHASSGGGDDARRRAGDGAVWLPVGRYPRATLGPVVLHGDDRSPLVRMPSTETNRLLAAGVIRLLTLLEDAAREDHADAGREGGPPSAAGGSVLPGRPGRDRQARWLLHAAVSALVLDGRTDWPVLPVVTAHGIDFPEPRVDPDTTERRTALVHHLGALFDVTAEGRAGDAPPHALLGLLGMLAAEQVLVARLPVERRRVRVEFTAPELGATALPWWRRRWIGRDIAIRYDTTIPAAVESWHVSVTVPPQVEVRRMLLSSDADSRAVTVLREDLAALHGLLRRGVEGVEGGEGGEGGDGPGGAPSEALRVYELGSIRSRLAELGRRRSEDVTEYRRYVRAWRGRLGGGRRREPAPLPALGTLRRLLEAAPDGRGTATALARLRIEDDAAAPDERHLLGEDLRAVGERLRLAGVEWDLHLDNDPGETSGHVLWRRRTGLDLPRDQPVRARVWVSLVDAQYSRAVGVLGLLLVNAALVTALLLVIRPGSQAEVTVTLLLLVPGVLLTRLDTSPQRSVLARLRAVPLALAWLSLGVNTALAIALTGQYGARDTVVLVLAGVLYGLLLASAVYAVLGQSWRWTPVPRHHGLPTWLLDEFYPRRQQTRAAPDVWFRESAEGESPTARHVPLWAPRRVPRRAPRQVTRRRE